MIALGNCGGLPGEWKLVSKIRLTEIGSFIFLQKESPKYPTGFGGSLSFAAAGVVAALTLETAYSTMNKRAAKKTEDEWRTVYTEGQLEKMGDRSPLFKYSL